MAEAGETEPKTNARRLRQPAAVLLADAPRGKSSFAMMKLGLVWLFGSLGPIAALTLGFEQRRLLVALPFFLIFGLLAAAILPFDPHPIALLVAVVVLAVLLFQYRQHLAHAWGLVLGLGFVTGFGLLSLHGTISGGPMLAYPAYGIYSAKVDEVLRADDEAQRIIVSNIRAVESADRQLPVRRARLFIRGAPVFRPGDMIEGSFRFAKVPGPIVPGGFDFQFHGFFEGIGSYGSATGPVRIVQTGTPGWQRGLDGLRRGIGQRIDLSLEQPAQGIARALIIGDQSQISDEIRATMASAGLAHILAISGLHLTLVAGGVFAVTRLALAGFYGLGQRIAIKQVAALAGSGAAIFYLLLSGASVSATRATIMLLLVFGAVLVGRRALTMRNVAFAALIVILLEPAAVFRPSFQLSFSAVTALIAVYEMTRTNHERPAGWLGKTGRFFGSMALTSLIAGLATAAFAAYHFQQTAPLGVLGNIAALPLVGFVVLPMCFLAVLVMPFGLEGAFLKAMEWGVDVILRVAENVARWSAPLSATPLLGPATLVICLGALAWLAIVPTRLRFAGVLVSIPLVILFGVDRSPDILVADSSQAVAVRGVTGMGLISGRSPSFAVSAWSETYMEEINGSFEGGACDKAGCIAPSSLGFELAVIKRADAFAEECARADVIVTRLYAPSWCRGSTKVIDAGDLRIEGVHWLRWDDRQKKFETRTAITNPHRAWRVPF